MRARQAATSPEETATAGPSSRNARSRSRIDAHWNCGSQSWAAEADSRRRRATMRVMDIRQATPSDLEPPLALRARLWPDALPDQERGSVQALLAGRPESTLPLVMFIALVDGSAVGFVEVGLRSHADGCEPTRPCGFLEGWYVTPEHRRNGIGRALVERAQAWASEQGAIEMASDTWLDADISLQAHERLGFEVVDRCVHFRKALPRKRVATTEP